MINSIIFDLSEVYLHGFFGVETQLSKYVDLDIEAIKRDCYPAKIGNYDNEFQDLMNGNISEDEYCKRFIKRTGWNISADDLKSAIRDNFCEIDGTRDIIESLKDKGYKMALLSDHSREWIEYCNSKYDYHKLFDIRQYSYEVGCCKSDQQAFNILLGKLAENPENCLFIDDMLRNINVSRGLGINAIQFKNPSQLIEDLKEYSIYIEAKTEDCPVLTIN